MSLSIPPDMIRFDPSYSRDIFSDTKPVSISDLNPEEVQPVEIFSSQFANLNMCETGNVMRTAVFKLRTNAEAAREMDFRHTVSPVKTWQSYSGTVGLSSWIISINLIARPIDLGSVVLWEDDAKVKATWEVRHSYASRIEFLQEEATAEGVTLNKDSERDFWTFIKLIPFVRRGSLFLMDNGDLRVVWDDDEDNLLGLQFLGNSLARYVVFKRRTEDDPVSRVAGTDTLKGVNAQIEAFKLGTLLSL